MARGSMARCFTRKLGYNLFVIMTNIFTKKGSICAKKTLKKNYRIRICGDRQPGNSGEMSLNLLEQTSNTHPTHIKHVADE
jgi:hypothetical protein